MFGVKSHIRPWQKRQLVKHEHLNEAVDWINAQVRRRMGQPLQRHPVAQDVPTGVCSPWLGVSLMLGSESFFDPPLILIPAGYLLLDGGTYLETDYPALYALVERNFGGSATAGTFKLPDFRGRIPIGLDNMGLVLPGESASSANRITDAQADIVGGTGGVEEVTLTGAQSGTTAHTHTISGDPHTHDIEIPVNSSAAAGTAIASSDDAGTPNTVVLPSQNNSALGIDSTSEAAAAEAHDNTQPWIALNWIVKT